MNILIFNGSPRDGNTKFALNKINEGITENIKEAKTEVLDIAKMGINPCIGCDSCISNDGVCVFEDDGADIVEKVRNADILIFGSPVYWWGITAQLKTVIDRLYALAGKPANNKIRMGLLSIGQDKVSGPQYAIISKQFECIGEHLGWEIIFDKAISAYEPNDVNSNETEVDELKNLWKKI